MRFTRKTTHSKSEDRNAAEAAIRWSELSARELNASQNAVKNSENDPEIEDVII